MAIRFTGTVLKYALPEAMSALRPFCRRCQFTEASPVPGLSHKIHSSEKTLRCGRCLNLVL